MNTVVLKFGGRSVAKAQNFSEIADLIVMKKKEYERVIVVISAMGNTTDQLIQLAKEVHPDPPRREYDMLVTVGERISIALLAMALAKKNQEAISFTGSQSGIITCEHHSDARIVDVRPHRLMAHLNVGKVVIVAGFQGVSQKGEITTLGRGGSDTSAVALGVSFKADQVEFFKDVDGVYDSDPKVNPSAKWIQELTYEEALGIAAQGTFVLQARGIELARKNSIPLIVQTFEKNNVRFSLIQDRTRERAPAPIFEL